MIYVPGLHPSNARAMPVDEVAGLLREQFGDRFAATLAGNAEPPGPVAANDDPRWIQRTNTVGVNVRTVGSFWRVVHFALTVPPFQNAVHLLPIWEPGVVGSLYGMASWEINREFFDGELARFAPHLDTAEKQLRFTVNTLHLMGRAVGMDVIPHTDRYSQIVLSHPRFFEWMVVTGGLITEHFSQTHQKAEEEIIRFVGENGPALQGADKDLRLGDLFADHVSETRRNEILFGRIGDPKGRNERREAIVAHLHQKGLEPVPATMGPPYRGIEVDPASVRSDTADTVWYEYRISKPESFSRVFGPLARYKFYERTRDNADWEIDFSQPRTNVWDYFTSHYADVQERFSFDFMRGDMSHVQMRPEGVPAAADDFYDPLRAAKERVQQRRPSFAYFAESFLAPDNAMAFGNEVDHLEASGAEVTLGDLQSEVVGSDRFLSRFRAYLDIAAHRKVKPSFAIMTGDKDDPRFDEFYRSGNELRLFCALFLVDLPSYMALGFRVRDRHDKPAPNEFYSKLYVFHEELGPKATAGPYRFGSNERLFAAVGSLYAFAERVLPQIADGSTHWLLPPDPSASSGLVAWTCISAAPDAQYIFVCNADTTDSVFRRRIPVDRTGTGTWQIDFCIGSPERADSADSAGDVTTDDYLFVSRMHPGECRAYRLQTTR